MDETPQALMCPFKQSATVIEKKIEKKHLMDHGDPDSLWAFEMLQPQFLNAYF